MSEPLYVKCVVCAGTKKIRTEINRGRKGNLLPGAKCFACCDKNGEGEPTGFVEYGVSDAQLQGIIRQRDTLLVLADDIDKQPNGKCEAEAALAAYVKKLAHYVAGARQRLEGKPDIFRKALPPDPAPIPGAALTSSPESL